MGVTLRFASGNLFATDYDAIVNPVNCVGIMGKGLALEFKTRFPDNFTAYEKACKQRAVLPGQMFVTDTRLKLPRWIINFPTKRHWKDKSREEDIVSGLSALAAEIRALGVRKIAVPALGCGLGGLEWDIVKAAIVASLKDVDVDVVVFEPK